ncbi:MAG: type IV pilus secretin PilQ [Azoarcus sp.]|jgi:type IV pilus assembly protein PilQ|nr:type IV pilus secretin PilQ [Azoarcus sp.]
MSNRISALLLAAAAAGLFAPAVPAWAQANDPAQAQAGAGLNSIQKLDVAEDGSAIYVRLSTQAPLAAMPASFTQANPPRIVFDFPSTGNGLGRGTQSIELGDLRSATIAQVGDRTRLVLNLSRLLSYDTRVAGNAVTIALSPGGAPVAAKSAGLSASNLAAAKPVARKGQSVSDINFRRGAGGEGRVVVQLSSAEVGVDVQQQGGKLVVSFLKTALPDNLRRRSDVTDFGTPVTALQAEQQGENVRLTVTPNGLWEHNAYQSDDQFILEVRRLVEDPEKLVQRSGGRVKYAGNKLSLNFQNVDVRSVLQVVADFTDFNIVTSDSVQGNLTLRLKDVPWDQALDIILQAKGLDMRKNGNVIWIAPGEELAAREKLINEARAQVEELEPLQTETFQINYHRATEITQFLQAKGQTVLSKRGSVVVDDRSNKVFVTDVGSRLADVRRVITEIDVAPRQVLIEARIVEASKNFARDLGVKLGYGDTRLKNLGGGAQLGFGQSDYTGALNQDKPGGVVPAGAAITSGSGIGSPFGQLGLTLVNKNLTRFVNIELQVQEQDGKARTISSPRVLTANNVEAMIEQGNEIPYQEASSSGSTSTSFKKAVLALKVKPQITPDGRLQLAIQVNKDRPLPGLILNGRSSEPPLETKSVKSDVLVENGGTVVIGGIYTDEEKVSVSKVPLLGDIPVLGHLFRTTSKSTNETELLIFVTPRIVDESLTLR